MKRRLDTLVDRGCWIADDRIYAFVTAAGITEVGYHGSQPVSRNSRILVRPEGVLTCALRSSGGKEVPLAFSEIDWSPGRIDANIKARSGSLRVAIIAGGRALEVRFSGSFAAAKKIVVRVSKDAFYRDVQGERNWTPARVEHDAVTLQCRDRIMLHPWIDRSGPYAGDFLIPEPWRKFLFVGSKRSGLATSKDLHPSVADMNFPLYDASIGVRFSGEGFQLNDEREAWSFVHPCKQGTRFNLRFAVRCGDDPEEIVRRTAPARQRRKFIFLSRTPRLQLDGYPRWEEFFASVPGLVQSCVVHDVGAPRACPGRYYWLWAWDMLVSAGEAVWWGEAALAETTARFVNARRDHGIIPARWTRSFLPLDTPSPGGIEFLFAALVNECSTSGKTEQILLDAYPVLCERLKSVSPQILSTGVVRGEGFYPDLPSSIGRDDQSAVSMEVGCWYSLCRIIQNSARRLGDRETETLADGCATSISRLFDSHFWDEKAGFFVDSIGGKGTAPRAVHPLFALLFLYTPLGFSLVRGRIARMGAFIVRHLLTPEGMRVVPLDEGSAGTEVVMDSWYPHWDLYALKVLRRAGYAHEIVSWLRRSEQVLDRLGYCPEFLSLSGFRAGEADAWARHGAASNLNCVTGWYRAMRESVLGIETDPGGLTHIPLALSTGHIRIESLWWRGGLWDIEVDYGGQEVESFEVDGERIDGCLKVPARHVDSGKHHLVIRYGGRKPRLRLNETVNAEVEPLSVTNREIVADLKGLGFVGVSFVSRDRPQAAIDGRVVETVWNEETGEGYFEMNLAGKHQLKLQGG